jgi:hypothetical protein
VGEQARAVAVAEVARVFEDEPPVGGVADRGHQVAAQLAGLVWQPDDHHECHDGEQREYCREKPLCPSYVEFLDGDPAGLSRLDDEQAGDQVAGEHEEDVDAEIAAPEDVRGVTGRAQVVNQHRPDGECAHAIEPWGVPQARAVIRSSSGTRHGG